MKKIFSSNAPVPAGHYEQGWKTGDLVFVSGQLPIDPKTKANNDGTAAEQTMQSLNNVKAVLEAAGTNLNRVVKVTVYVSDIAKWDEINAAYKDFFGEHRPARSVVPTPELHYGFQVEIEAIATL
ncbi:enamine deaminase RidA [Pseudaminobacter manganicus]|uniref:Enamine deaminase RidA n=2 Tax=Manganibacter manganicus TaxID=1873176 RepID=A0A1V8RU70_9HYPH|nr:enamine deaminase RidA [Pseudaminobacter manganicus]